MESRRYSMEWKVGDTECERGGGSWMVMCERNLDERQEREILNGNRGGGSGM